MIRLLLGIAAVVGLWFIATDTGAQPQTRHGAKVHQFAHWPRTVTGVGPTEKEAQQNAVANAVKRVNECLRAQNPPITAWQADEEYVRDHLLDGPGQPGDEVAPVALGPVKVWVQPLREPDVSDLVARNQRAERRSLSSERQTMAGYGLAVLSMLLAIAWGYLRLDEWTGGRISLWLRIGAVAMAALAAAAYVLWWLSA